MSARERRGRTEPTGACTVLSRAHGGGRTAPEGSSASAVVETVGAGAGESAGCPDVAARSGGRRAGLALQWSAVVVLVHTWLLERGVALAGSGTGTSRNWREHSGAGR